VKALTVYRPWSLFIAYGDKRVENRSWRPPAHVLGKRVAIHSGKHFDEYPVELAEELGLIADMLHAKELPTGIVATAIVSGCAERMLHVPVDQERWFSGPFGWLLGDVKAFREPIPCLGAQGLWTVPEDIEKEIQRRNAA